MKENNPENKNENFSNSILLKKIIQGTMEHIRIELNISTK